MHYKGSEGIKRDRKIKLYLLDNMWLCPVLYVYNVVAAYM